MNLKKIRDNLTLIVAIVTMICGLLTTLAKTYDTIVEKYRPGVRVGIPLDASRHSVVVERYSLKPLIHRTQTMGQVATKFFAANWQYLLLAVGGVLIILELRNRKRKRRGD